VRIDIKLNDNVIALIRIYLRVKYIFIVVVFPMILYYEQFSEFSLNGQWAQCPKIT